MWQYFAFARKAATNKHDVRGILIGACGVRNDGCRVVSSNGPVIMFNESKGSYPAAHAEARLARKLDVGSVVFVCRVRKVDGSFACARPCPDCQRTLTSRGIKKVYYTISNTEYGVMYLN